MSNWIRCSDSMPEICIDVLIRVINPPDTLMAYLSNSGEFCYDRDCEGEEVTCKATHWMPLPDPPIEVE